MRSRTDAHSPPRVESPKMSFMPDGCGWART
jgi:hypothetical protein